MYKVKYKSHNASQTWASHGSYANEQSALNNASRIHVNTSWCRSLTLTVMLFGLADRRI